jgi:4-hydroxybenzoate polyprenyltransferase
MTASKIRVTLEMIKFEHSVFALPFALMGALLAGRYAGPGWPTWPQLGWIVAGMVGARSAAMTMNRIADLDYDRRNPRTAQRPLVTGALSLQFAWLFTIISSALLIVAAWRLNSLALKLSPIVLTVLFGYSYTKRFTTWAHLVLGFCLGMAPAAAWIAVSGSLDWRMVVLCAAVTLWVAGFDVLYALQDIDFDRQSGLFSIPKKFGVRRALAMARAMHAVMFALMAFEAWSFALPWPACAGLAVVGVLLAYEHSLVRPGDLSRINAAFFTVNGYISILLLVSWGAAIWVSQS